MVSGMPTEPAAAPKPGGWPRWRGPVLFVSLVLNLFLIGVIVGGWAHHRHGAGWLAAMRGEPRMAGGPGGPREGPSQIRQAVQALPEADRHVFEETMKPLRAEFGKDQQEIRRIRQRASDAIRTEPFDQQAFLAAMGELRQKQIAIQTRVHGGTAEALAKIAPDARKQFADHFGPRPRP